MEHSRLQPREDTARLKDEARSRDTSLQLCLVYSSISQDLGLGFALEARSEGKEARSSKKATHAQQKVLRHEPWGLCLVTLRTRSTDV